MHLWRCALGGEPLRGAHRYCDFVELAMEHKQFHTQMMQTDNNGKPKDLPPSQPYSSLTSCLESPGPE